MLTARGLAPMLALAAGYALVVRPRLIRWGATDEELRRPYPGAELIPGGERSATMAVTIDAEPSRVWPWLVQMGADRAGWYSWDRLDNWGHPSADRIHPEWQEISVGDRLAATPDGRQWWEVAALEPERFLGLRMSLDLRGRPFDPRHPPPPHYTDSLWGFLLGELPGRRTRLLVSGYWSLRPRWLQPVASIVVLEPSHWIMHRASSRTSSGTPSARPRAPRPPRSRPDRMTGRAGRRDRARPQERRKPRKAGLSRCA